MPDVVVIGGGHNGLVCAAYLARAGLSVTLVERRHVLGGAAVTEEVFPGFKYSVCSYAVSLLRPEIIRELALTRHGLALLPIDGTFTPLRDATCGGGRPGGKHAEDRASIAARRGRYASSTTTKEMADLRRPLLGMNPTEPHASKCAGLDARWAGVPPASGRGGRTADPAAVVGARSIS